MAKLELKRFEVTAYQNKSGADAAQIPSTALATVYKAGATVSAGVTVTTSGLGTAVQVYNIGRLAATDTVQIGADDTKTLAVVSIDSDGQVKLRSTTGASITLLIGDRILPTTDQPTLFTDPIGTVAFSPAHSVTLDAQGFGYFYCPEAKFDYILSGTGLSSALFIEAEGGWMRDGVSWVNVKNFSTFQAAIDALPAVGGTVFVPAGTYTRLTTPAVVPMTITRRTNLLGEGDDISGAPTTGSILKYQNGGVEDVNSDLLTFSGHGADRSCIEKLSFIGANAAGTGRGLVLNTVSNTIVRDCAFYQFPSWAVATDGAGEIVIASFDHCEFLRSVTNGLMQFGGSGGSVAWFCKVDNCGFVPAAGRIIEIKGAFGTQITHCTLESDLDPASANGDTGAFIFLQSNIGGGNYSLYGTKIHHNWFESVTATNPPNNWFIYLKGPNANTAISGNHFARANAVPTKLRAIKTETAPATYATFNFVVDNNYGILGGATSNGTDDFVIGDTSSGYIAHNLLADGVQFTNPWRVTAADATWLSITRVNENRRSKVPGLSLFQRDLATYTVDKKAGDYYFNTDIGTLQHYDATGKWRNMSVQSMTTAARDALIWEVGDMIWNTTTSQVNFCTVAGSPGTWKVW